MYQSRIFNIATMSFKNIHENEILVKISDSTVYIAY